MKALINGISIMNDSQITHFSNLLNEMRAHLNAQDDIAQDSQKTVVLDQQSVGRLSRMGALQQQAMANAAQARRAQQSQHIDAAFKRIDEGEFGICTSCGEDIPTKRMKLDPTVVSCVTCAAG